MKRILILILFTAFAVVCKAQDSIPFWSNSYANVRFNAFALRSRQLTYVPSLKDSNSLYISLADTSLHLYSKGVDTKLSAGLSQAQVISLIGQYAPVLDTSHFWNVNGNSNVSHGFLGTVDTSSLNFRVNNIQKLSVSSNGVFVSSDLTVDGVFNLSGTPFRAGYFGYGRSLFIGQDAGTGVTGYGDIFIGSSAGASAFNTCYSNFIGDGAGSFAAGMVEYSNFIGSGAGNSAGGAYSSNFIGQDAGAYQPNASYSNFIGSEAGSFYVGDTLLSNNIIIGTNISLPNNAANQMSIGNVLYGTGLNYNGAGGGNCSLVPAMGKIGINIINPSQALEVNGQIKVDTLQNGSLSDSLITSQNNVLRKIKNPSLPLVAGSTNPLTGQLWINRAGISANDYFINCIGENNNTSLSISQYNGNGLIGFQDSTGFTSAIIKAADGSGTFKQLRLMNLPADTTTYDSVLTKNSNGNICLKPYVSGVKDSSGMFFSSGLYDRVGFPADGWSISNEGFIDVGGYVHAWCVISIYKATADTCSFSLQFSFTNIDYPQCILTGSGVSPVLSSFTSPNVISFSGVPVKQGETTINTFYFTCDFRPPVLN